MGTRHEHNIKPSAMTAKAKNMPLFAMAARKKLAGAAVAAAATRKKSSTIDPFLEGYITSAIEQGNDYQEILDKCARKGYEVSRNTVKQFMETVSPARFSSSEESSRRRDSSYERQERRKEYQRNYEKDYQRDYQRNQRKQSSDSSNTSSTSTDPSLEKDINVFEVVSRGIITVLNLLFFMVSAILIAFGVLVKYGSSNMFRNLEPIFDSVQKLSAEKHYPLGTISITHLILEAATIAIVLGAVMMAISFFGWCGACCRKRSMLSLYCALLTFILASQVTIVILLAVMRSRVDLALKKPLKETLLYKYKGIQGQDSLSVSWNYVMNNLKCCGVEGYEDFDKARVWDRIYHDPHSRKSVHLTVPLVCCKNLGDYPEIEPPKNFTCAIQPNRWTSNYMTGCYNEIWDYISGAELTLAGIMMVSTIIQMMLIFASVYLIARITDFPDSDDESSVG